MVAATMANTRASIHSRVFDFFTAGFVFFFLQEVPVHNGKVADLI
jgi:hypothetical protein